MNYSHDNWSAILAHIGKPEELDTSARNAGALTRRREIRDAATLLRLGLAYGPGGMSLREVTAWAQLHDVATLSDVPFFQRAPWSTFVTHNKTSKCIEFLSPIRRSVVKIYLLSL